MFALASDWLTEEVSFHFAPEVYSEINRDKDKHRGEKTRLFLSQFIEARFTPDLRDVTRSHLLEIFPSKTENDESDCTQLAECIASGIQYFITTDKGILKHGDLLFEKFGLRVLRPADFILNIDQLKNSHDYRSYRIAGATYEYTQLGVEQISHITDLFVNHERREKKHTLVGLLTKIASDIKNSSIRLIKDKDGKFIGFVTITLNQKTLNVEALRISNIRIRVVLLQRILHDLINLALEKEVTYIQLQELHPSEEFRRVFMQFGFEEKDNTWYRPIISGQLVLEEIISRPEVKSFTPVSILYNKLVSASPEQKILAEYNIERLLWPVKIKGIDLPVYIVPIKPYWAGELFDHQISKQSIFGSKAELVWNRENVYYRSVKPVTEKTPARILWYLSSDPKSNSGRFSSIVACSYLDEAIIGQAKDLYQRFKNFGIYEWKNILELAKNDPLTEIKALRFSDTEVFNKQVSLKKINEIFTHHGRSTNTFASPLKISQEVFNDIYELGKR